MGSSSIRVPSLPDLVLDRLLAFVHWRSPIDGLNAVRLLLAHGLEIADAIEGRLSKDPIGAEGLALLRDLATGALETGLSASEIEESLESWFQRS